MSTELQGQESLLVCAGCVRVFVGVMLLPRCGPGGWAQSEIRAAALDIAECVRPPRVSACTFYIILMKFHRYTFFWSPCCCRVLLPVLLLYFRDLSGDAPSPLSTTSSNKNQCSRQRRRRGCARAYMRAVGVLEFGSVPQTF